MGDLQPKTPLGRIASVDLPDRNLAPIGFRLLALMEAGVEVPVQREWEARTARLKEMGRREWLTQTGSLKSQRERSAFYYTEAEITESGTGCKGVSKSWV